MGNFRMNLQNAEEHPSESLKPSEEVVNNNSPDFRAGDNR